MQTGLPQPREALRGTTVDEVSFLVVDLADPAAIAALTAEVGKLEPKVDVLVNNAGIELDMPFDGDHGCAIRLRNRC